MGSADNRDDEQAAAAPLFVLPPVDLSELVIALCVTLNDARHQGAAFARALRRGRPDDDLAHLVAISREVACAAVAQSREMVGVRALALQVDREGLWASIRENFARGAELELMRRAA